jgi:hypothetical protein
VPGIYLNHSQVVQRRKCLTTVNDTNPLPDEALCSLAVTASHNNLWRCGNHIYKDSSSAPTCAKPAPHARPTAPANNSGDKSSGGSDSESSEAAFLPGSGKDEDGASSGSDVDVILSGDDSVIEVSAPDCPKEKSKGKKKRLKGRKSKGKAKVQLQAAIATIPDAEKEPETDEVELGVYFKVDLLYPSHDKPLIAWLQKKWTMVSSI